MAEFLDTAAYSDPKGITGYKSIFARRNNFERIIFI